MPRRSHLGEGGLLYPAFRSYVSARHQTLLPNLQKGGIWIAVKHSEAPSRQTNLLPNLNKAKTVALKPLGEGGHAMNEPPRPNLYESQVCRAEANKRRRMKFYYVYILRSEIDQRRFYTGFT